MPCQTVSDLTRFTMKTAFYPLVRAGKIWVWHPASYGLMESRLISQCPDHRQSLIETDTASRRPDVKSRDDVSNKFRKLGSFCGRNSSPICVAATQTKLTAEKNLIHSTHSTQNYWYWMFSRQLLTYQKKYANWGSCDVTINCRSPCWWPISNNLNPEQVWELMRRRVVSMWWRKKLSVNPHHV